MITNTVFVFCFTEQVPMMNISYKPQKISPKSQVIFSFC